MDERINNLGLLIYKPDLWNQPMDLLFFALEVQKLRFSVLLKLTFPKEQTQLS